MTFTILEDISTVKEVIQSGWEASADDFSGNAEAFTPPVDPRVIYIGVYDEAELLGLWMFVQHTPILWEAHTCLLPTCGYRRGRAAARQMAEWIWDNTKIARIFTQVPEYNLAARMFATAAGMEYYGDNRQSHQKNGKLFGLLQFGLSRPSLKMT